MLKLCVSECVFVCSNLMKYSILRGQYFWFGSNAFSVPLYSSFCARVLLDNRISYMTRLQSNDWPIFLFFFLSFRSNHPKIIFFRSFRFVFGFVLFVRSDPFYFVWKICSTMDNWTWTLSRSMGFRSFWLNSIFAEKKNSSK